ncbi:MAG: NAD-dependent epimerase/dehydratase family protein [Acidobacteriota bacterium]|nr:NAD-dependent epimerase/dehydratase family protein [Blastocatellia bacterium]MDW8240015.1 NAD-dependent epimerase/dehydratase family protein [Acidobacteriota bacterium]
MAILITGGTGLVGSHLIEDLITGGIPAHSLRALVRPQRDTAFLRAQGVELCYGDVTDPDSLKAALSGIQTVFHCAAAVDEKRRELFWQVNYQGTVNLLQEAQRAGVQRFVHVSTIGVYGLLQTSPATEEHPKNPLRPYAAAKLAAEEKLWQYHQSGLNVVVLRPTAIVGERDRTITKRLVQLARRRVVPLIGDGRSHVSFVYVKDLTRAMILASQSERAVGHAYNVQGFTAPIRQVLEFFIDAVGSRAKLIPIPYAAAYAGALLLDAVLTLTRPNDHPLRARKGIQQLTRDLTFDTTKIKTDLNFEPRYDMAQSFGPAIRWQLEHG